MSTVAEEVRIARREIAHSLTQLQSMPAPTDRAELAHRLDMWEQLGWGLAEYLRAEEVADVEANPIPAWLETTPSNTP